MNRPTFSFLFLYIFLSATCVVSQDLSISGFVDDGHNQPVSYANVLLMKAQDSLILKGVSSDERGFFLLNGLATEKYLLKVSFLGFKDVYKSVHLSESLDLGTIVLEEDSEQLNEINIVAKRPTLKKEPDRLVFNIENTALTEGNMFQVLKSTPGILVMDDNILVKNSVPTVYINNKKVNLSNDELVQLLEGSSANSIKSIEVITNPSAKYDAESGAVINIVMSKNLATGYRGNVFTNYTQGVYPRYEVGTSHFFKNNKIDFFANYTYSDSKTNRFQTNEINYLDANNVIDETFQSVVDRTTWSKTHNFNFNFDYSIDDSNTLSLTSSTLLMPYFKYTLNNNTHVFDANQVLDFYYNANNLSNDDKYNIGFDLDFVHDFKTAGEKLSFNAHYTTYNYARDQNVVSNYFNPDNTFLTATAFTTDNNQDTNIFTVKTDYSLPISDSSVLELGAKASNIKINSDIAQYDIINNQEIYNPNNSDAFDYDESIYAAYANYSRDWEKLSLILGLRAEQTKLNGYAVADDITNTQDYFELFPTASLQYTFSDNFSLYTNYKRSIERPDYQNLNPFKFFLNDYTIVTGNPNLNPVFNDHAVIGTSFYKSIFTIEAYYSESDQNIYELPRQDNVNNTITYSPINIDKTTEYGFDFLVNFNLTERWSVYFVTSFYNRKDEDVFDGMPVVESKWANFTQTNHNISFLKDRSLSANLSLTYSSKYSRGFVETDEVLFSELSFSKTILKKNGILSLTFSDLFNTQDFNTAILYLNQNSKSHISSDTRYVKLGFRYKFGNTNLSTNERGTGQQETDRLEKRED